MASLPKTDVPGSLFDPNSVSQQGTVDQSDNKSCPATSPSLQASPATADNMSQERDERTITEHDRQFYKFLTNDDEHDTIRVYALPTNEVDLKPLYDIHCEDSALGHSIRGGQSGVDSTTEEGPSVGQKSLGGNKQEGIIVESGDTVPKEKLTDEIAYLRDGLPGVFANHGWE
jgi:hypothetical protein